MSINYRFLATDKSLDVRGLKCVTGERCWRTIRLEECARLCDAEGSKYFQYGKGVRDSDCMCAMDSYQYPLTVDTNWDIYGVRSHTLEEIQIPESQFGLLASDRTLVGNLRCIDADRCLQANVALSECAKLCGIRGSMYFQYGKGAKAKGCLCAIHDRHYRLNIHTDWDIYGFEGHTLEELTGPRVADSNTSGKETPLLPFLIGSAVLALLLLLMLTIACCFLCRRRTARDVGCGNKNHARNINDVDIKDQRHARNIEDVEARNAVEIPVAADKALRAQAAACDLIAPVFVRPRPLMPTAPCGMWIGTYCKDWANKDVNGVGPLESISPRKTRPEAARVMSAADEFVLPVFEGPRPLMASISVTLTDQQHGDERSTTDPSGMTEQSSPDAAGMNEHADDGVRSIETFASSIVWDCDCASDQSDCHRRLQPEQDSTQSTTSGTSDGQSCKDEAVR